MSIIHRIARALGIVLARARHRGIPKRLFDAPRDAARDPRDEKVVCPTDRRVDVPHTDARVVVAPRARAPTFAMSPTIPMRCVSAVAHARGTAPVRARRGETFDGRVRGRMTTTRARDDRCATRAGAGRCARASSMARASVEAKEAWRRRRETTDGRRRAIVAGATAAADGGESVAIVNTVKAIFGAGGFALPWAFAQGGIALVGSCMFASLVLALESLRMLVKSQDVLVAAGDASAAEVATYAGLTKTAFGPIGDVACRVMNVLTCFGITVSYLVFIAKTLQVLMPALGVSAFGVAPTLVSMLNVVGPFMIALGCIREMSGVATISAVGTASVAIGMIMTATAALSNPLQLGALPLANFAAFPGFFGTVAFLFFIHFTLFGIKEAMPQPDKFFGAAVKAFTGAAAFAAAFGVAGAAGYGPAVSDVVVTMLTGWSGVFVQLLLCLNLLATYPIMAQSALRICENVFEGDKPGSISTPASVGVRTAFTAGAIWTAGNVPNFGVVIGYVGGVCCSILSLVLPAMILYQSQNKVKNTMTANELARIGGVFATGLTCIVLSIVL